LKLELNQLESTSYTTNQHFEHELAIKQQNVENLENYTQELKHNLQGLQTSHS